MAGGRLLATVLVLSGDLCYSNVFIMPSCFRQESYTSHDRNPALPDAVVRACNPSTKQNPDQPRLYNKTRSQNNLNNNIDRETAWRVSVQA